MYIGESYGSFKEKKSQLAENITIHVTSSPEKAPIMYNEVLKNSVSDNFVFEGIIRHDNLLDFYKSATALVFLVQLKRLVFHYLKLQL